MTRLFNSCVIENLCLNRIRSNYGNFQLNFHQNQIKHVTMLINNVRIRNLLNIRYCYNYEYQAQTLASG